MSLSNLYSLQYKSQHWLEYHTSAVMLWPKQDEMPQRNYAPAVLLHLVQAEVSLQLHICCISNTSWHKLKYTNTY